MNKERNEIRSYAYSSVMNVAIGIFSLYPVILLIVSVGNGSVSVVWPTIAAIAAAIVVLWIVSRRGAYISINTTDKTLSSAVFGLKTRSIAISSITHIGTRGAFGGWTVMQITYRQSNGKERTGGYGAKQTLERKSFQEILDALVNINPNLHIPSELRK
jgi:hypothetical protein